MAGLTRIRHMHEDDWNDLRASLALLRLAWPQLVTLFGFLFAVLLRYPMWFGALTVFVVAISIARIAVDVARNPDRPFDFMAIDYLLVGAGWSASLLSMRWWSVERVQHLEPGALLTQTSQYALMSAPWLAWRAALTQWLACALVLVVTLVWAFSGRYLD
jgi:hypothetical protein